MKSFGLITGFLLLFATATSLAAPSGEAEWLVEPSIGYCRETIQLTNRLQEQTKLKTANPVFGLKLGGRSPLGVDFNLAYDYSSGKVEVRDEPEKNPFSHQTGSFQLGLNAMDFMKIYLGYAFLNDFRLGDTSALAGYKLSGPAYIVGLQLKIFRYVNIGAQYNLNQFNKISGHDYSLGDDTEKYFNNIDAQDYSFVLSVEL